jgi:hypothetical protein
MLPEKRQISASQAIYCPTRSGTRSRTDSLLLDCVKSWSDTTLSYAIVGRRRCVNILSWARSLRELQASRRLFRSVLWRLSISASDNEQLHPSCLCALSKRDKWGSGSSCCSQTKWVRRRLTGSDELRLLNCWMDH